MAGRSPGQEFQGREGTGDEGKDFKELMIISKCLELALDVDVKEFSISSDDKAFGDFNDLVVAAEFHNGNTSRTAVQLKHVEAEKKALTPQILGSTSKKFSICKYYQNSNEIHADYTLILYTNKYFQMKVDQLAMKCKIGVNDELLLDIVKTSCKNVYEFNMQESQNNISKKEIDAYTNFLKRFQLMSNQENTKELQNRIMDEFHKLHGTEDTFHRFRDFIGKWKNNKKNRSKLNKNFVVIKLVESLLSPYIKTTSGTHAYTDFGVILRKAILNFKITSFEETNDVIDKIWFNSKSDNEINRCGFKNFLLTDELDEIKGEKLQARKYSIISWYLGQCPLIIEVTEELKSTVRQAIDLLAENHIEDKKLLLLHHKPKQEDSGIFQNLFSVKTVDEDIFNEFLEKFSCSMQGKIRKLKEFVNSMDTSKIITTDCLVKMTNEKFNIGDAAEELPEFYVERVLPRIIVDFKFIDEAETNDVVLISCEGEMEVVRQQISDVKIVEARKLIQSNSSDSFLHQQRFFDIDVGRKKKIVSVHSSECTAEELSIISKKFPERNVHHLKYSKNHLEWMQTSGSIKTLQRYRLDRDIFHNQDDFLHHSENKTKIICAGPGIGKSSLLKSFKNSCQNSHWPVYISVNDHMSGIEANRDVQQFLFSLLKTNEKFEKNLVQKFYENKKILFLFDEIDELLDNQQRQIVYSFVKKIEELGFPLCIASRGHLKEELENEFNTFSTIINEFNETEQIQYITNRLSKKYNRKQLSEIIYKINENVKYLEAQSILGVPMQLFMLTELFLQSEDVENMLKQPLTATRLFDHFVNLKFEVYFQRINLNNKFMENITKETFFKKYQIFGVRICLDTIANLNFLSSDENDCLSKIETEADPVGLIVRVENILSFINRSYAEYFAAIFLSKNCSRLENFRSIYFDDRLRNVRFMMLDLILAEACPAHTAGLYRNSRSLEENRKDILKEDKGEINTLHLVLSCSTQYLTIPDLLEDTKLDDYLKNFQIVGHILKYLSESEQKLTLVSDKLCLMDYISLSSESLFELAVVTNDISIVKFVSKNWKLGTKHALNYAAFIGNSDICKFVLSQGREVRSYGKNNETPLMVAAAKGYLEIAKILIGNNAEVNKMDETGWSALHFAACKNRLPMVELLIKSNAGVNNESKNGVTPLLLAAMKGHSEIAKMLIDNKADVNFSSDDGITSLMFSARKGCLETAKILIGNNADVNVSEINGINALHLASNNNQLPMVELLIKSNAGVNNQTKKGATPLILAAQKGYSEIAKILIDNKAEVNQSTDDGTTLLMWAAQKGFLEIEKILIDNNAEVNKKDEDGWSALHYAACHNQLPIVELLIQGLSINSGSLPQKNVVVNLNSKNEKGDTALHLAARNNNLAIIKLLVQNGANMEAKNCNGETPDDGPNLTEDVKNYFRSFESRQM